MPFKNAFKGQRSELEFLQHLGLLGVGVENDRNEAELLLLGGGRERFIMDMLSKLILYAPPTPPPQHSAFKMRLKLESVLGTTGGLELPAWGGLFFCRSEVAGLKISHLTRSSLLGCATAGALL